MKGQDCRARRKCGHEVVAIPMPGKGESLNVAAAAAICLFERVRQLQSGRFADGLTAVGR
jgi:tRNA G18 (ribose-2'-O)-methylase SpoU